MQITRAEIIAVTLLIHQSLWPFRPLLWILQSGCQPYAQADHNQRPAVKPRYCCNRSIAWRISPRSIIGKAPAHNLLQCHSVLTFSRCLSGQAACGRSWQERSWRSQRVDWVLRFAWQVCEGDQIISTLPYNDVLIAGFLTSVIVLSIYASFIEERLTLIIDFYHLLLRLLAAKRLISRQWVSTDVADKHARYISEIAT